MTFQAQVKELKKRQHYCYDPLQLHEKNQKVRREFNCSNQLVSHAKEVLITKGDLSTPNPKKGKSLPVHVKDMVKEFYY